jgi:hypothetical protein
MARNMQMMPTTGRGGAGGKIVGLLILVVLLTLLVRDPVGFAHGVRAVFVAVGHMADALDRFGQAL